MRPSGNFLGVPSLGKGGMLMKTEHYGLMLWNGTSAISREMVNETAKTIDRSLANIQKAAEDQLEEKTVELSTALAEKAELVTGSYTGDGELTRMIELEFHPQAVLVVDEAGAMQSSRASYGGLAVESSPTIHGGTTIVEIVDDGFRVARGYQQSESTYWADTNAVGKTYHYLAVKM